MSKFIDEALKINSYLDNCEFDRMTFPKVIGKIISRLPELTFEQCRVIAKAITLPRPRKLTDNEFRAYKKRMDREGVEFPPKEEIDIFYGLSDEQLEEFERILGKHAYKKGYCYVDDLDKPIGVTGDGNTIYMQMQVKI